MNEMDEPCTVSNDSISTLHLMFNMNRSLRTMETWVRFNDRVKSAVGLDWDIDHLTMCREMEKIDEKYLKKLFHHLVMKLHDKGIITGKFLVVDVTHIYAYVIPERTQIDTVWKVQVGAIIMEGSTVIRYIT